MKVLFRLLTSPLTSIPLLTYFGFMAVQRYCSNLSKKGGVFGFVFVPSIYLAAALMFFAPFGLRRYFLWLFNRNAIAIELIRVESSRVGGDFSGPVIIEIGHKDKIIYRTGGIPVSSSEFISQPLRSESKGDLDFINEKKSSYVQPGDITSVKVNEDVRVEEDLSKILLKVGMGALAGGAGAKAVNKEDGGFGMGALAGLSAMGSQAMVTQSTNTYFQINLRLKDGKILFLELDGNQWRKLAKEMHTIFFADAKETFLNERTQIEKQMNAIRDNFDSLEAKDQTTASNQLRILSDSMATRDAYLKEIESDARARGTLSNRQTL